MTPTLELALVFVAIIIGTISGAYFYVSAGIFTDTLKKPLRLICTGMMLMVFGILLAAFMYLLPQQFGMDPTGTVLIHMLFYWLYIIGCLMILSGARKFASRPAGK